MRVLVTGATGYVGGRLVPRLLAAGHQVRVMVRDPARVKGRAWAEDVEVVKGDVLEPASLPEALEGVDVAYYLIHSMHAGKDFAERDREAVRNFTLAAGHLEHCIYLGGLLPPDVSASEHLSSRGEVGRILRETLPTTEFRAGPVIGSGSGSFEMVRYLTERLPIMVAPRWVDNLVQPIAIRDVLAYLEQAATMPPLDVVEIGGRDQLTFRQMMLTYAQVRGLTRRVISVPVLTPRLAGLWVGLVTPIPNRLAVPLIKGIVEPVVADTALARKAFPDIEPMGYREAVERALEKVRTGEVETRWSSALGAGPGYQLVQEEGLIQEVRSMVVEATPSTVYDVVAGLGGKRGWLTWNWAWRLRGGMDRLVGGPGLRRGRRHPDRVLPGEAVDFWRVAAVEPGHRIALRAEMRVPGIALLDWTIEDLGDRRRIEQAARLLPRGLWGRLYWLILTPFHGPIFRTMLSRIVTEADRVHSPEDEGPPPRRSTLDGGGDASDDGDARFHEKPEGGAS
ncbi:MAG: DUF2867 domain-containing protein [Candidatus Thermoplasmatota archaeon]|nr:DUF2867 domain-containing protein [Candidatus Thermoplasmatota archaeon]